MQVKEGPYLAEGVGGAFVFEAEDIEAAIALAARIPQARLGGAVEIRRRWSRRRAAGAPPGERAGDRERAPVVALRRGERWVPNNKIKRGVLAVHQYGGSREAFGSVHRFRWSRARGAFELIGLDTENADTLTGGGSSSSCNLLTGLCIETSTPPQVDEDGNPLRNARARILRRRVGTKPLLRLEDVGAEL